MKGLGAILRRELAGLFLAPLAWIVFFLAMLFQAYFFLLALDRNGGEVNGALSLVLGGGWPFWYLMLFVPPLLTMRMISEESRTGLLEFLLTAPVSDAAVVVGKALAATFFLAVLWGTVPLVGLLVAALGAPPDWGQLLTEWIGATLVSGLFCALGLIASALSATPLIAAFLAILVNIALVYLPLVASSVRGTSPSLTWILERIDVLAHFQGSFLTGALDTAHVVFFLAWTLAALFVAVRLVETRRWMG
jgi:ABC-2 type transport system permease protein